jgi:hypothetical protein
MEPGERSTGRGVLRLKEGPRTEEMAGIGSHKIKHKLCTKDMRTQWMGKKEFKLGSIHDTLL